MKVDFAACQLSGAQRDGTLLPAVLWLHIPQYGAMRTTLQLAAIVDHNKPYAVCVLNLAAAGDTEFILCEIWSWSSNIAANLNGRKTFAQGTFIAHQGPSGG